jgi:hypothetical protein
MIDYLLAVDAKDRLVLNAQVKCELFEDLEVDVLVICDNKLAREVEIVLLLDFSTIGSQDYLTSIVCCLLF